MPPHTLKERLHGKYENENIEVSSAEHGFKFPPRDLKLSCSNENGKVEIFLLLRSVGNAKTVPRRAWYHAAPQPVSSAGMMSSTFFTDFISFWEIHLWGNRITWWGWSRGMIMKPSRRLQSSFHCELKSRKFSQVNLISLSYLPHLNRLTWFKLF